MDRQIFCGMVMMVAGMASYPASILAADGAQARAVAYQAQTREVLKRHHWRITFDQAGKLVGRHNLGPGADDLGGAYSQPAGYARLTVLFKPQSSTNTGCEASIVACYVESVGRDGKANFTEPVPFNNPATSKSVEDLLAEARRQMIAAHPEYGAPRDR